MPERFDTVIRISSAQAEVTVEQRTDDGSILRKNISPKSLMECFWESRRNPQAVFTGLLPEHCIAATVRDDSMDYYIRYPELHADISYYKSEFRNFPLPQLVFGFRYVPKEGKVTSCRLCVVDEGRLTPETPTYHYPFSNVGNGGHICTGSNDLPAYQDATRLHTLAGHILRMPNNDDYYSMADNRLGLDYRALLEHMKDKPPAYYYTDVLVKDGKTLNDFLNGG